MKRRRGLAAPFAQRSPRPGPRRLVLERFEERLLLATFTVTVNLDDGQGSLRQAIIDANASPDPTNLINFSISGTPSIAPITPLPAITRNNLTINGAIGGGGKVELNGTNPGLTSGNGLTVLASNVSIRNLVINRFAGNGIALNGSNNLVTGTYIGTDVAGTALAGNRGNGILVNAARNQIGLAGAFDGPNVIAGNLQAQIVLAGPASETIIANNRIGTNATGTAALGVATNRPNGIEVSSADNTIGGTFSGAANLISGNNNGINLGSASATNNLIQGNLIGTDVTGTLAIANIQNGIIVSGAINNTIGGSLVGEGNVISGNTLSGILVQTGATGRVSGTLISGNRIGVTAADAPLGNLGTGITVNNTNTGFPNTGVVIGSPQFPGDSPELGNIIANNGGAGISVLAGSSVGIRSNSIYSNTGLGILLAANTNGGILPPFLETAQTITSSTPATRITGRFNGVANVVYRLQFFSNKTVNPGGDDGQTYLGFLDVTPTFNGQTDFVYLFPGAVDVGDEITATITQSPQVVNNTSQFSSSEFVIESQDPDLVVEVSTSPAQARVGQNLTYQVTVTNNGKSPAFGVELTDVIPANTVFVSSDNNSTYSEATRTVTRAINFLPVGQSVTINIVVRPTVSGVTITNVATATTQSLEANTLNNTVTTPLFVFSVADIQVFVSPDPNPVAVGSRLTYTVTLVNVGPSIAQNVVTTVQLPRSMTNVVVTIDQGTFTGPDANNVITITTGALPGVFSLPITITGTVNQVGPIDLTAVAVETTGEFDPNLANNTARSRVTVANAADLAVAIAPSKPAVLLGETFFYTIVVRNNGPSSADAPVLSHVAPAGLTFVPSASSTTSGTIASDGRTVTLDPIAQGASATIVLAFRATVAGPVVTRATIANPADIDLVDSNNTASATVLAAPSNIGVEILGPDGPLAIGIPAVYTILVSNAGIADAPNVILTDVVGVGATLVDATLPQGTFTIAGSTLTARLGTVPAGQTLRILVRVNPTASGVLANAAAVATSGFDPVPANNVATTTDLVSPADLGVTVTGPTTPILLGQPFTYTVTVFNGGPATAKNVVVANLLPGNAILVGATASQGTVTGAGLLTANLGSLASGGSATITITVIPTAVGSLVNTATVASDNFDPNAANNTASAGVATFDLPGTFVLVPGTASVNEDGGSITFIVNRVLGSLGVVSVDYATADLTGLSGLNYVGTSGTLVFAEGELSKTVTIPILDDNIIGGDVNFLLTLGNPQGGAVLSGDSTAVVTVVNTDRDTVAPRVVSIVPIGGREGITGFVITFDDAMDPTRAALLENYRITLSGRDPGRQRGSDVSIAGAVFDPVARTVTLTTAETIPSNRFYEVRLLTTGAQPLTDTSGNVLDGDVDGIGGGDYETMIGLGTSLRYRDSRDNVVTLSLRRGGTMTVTRDASGNAQTVALSGIARRRSILSGSVRRSRNGGNRITIGTISGLQRFGDVRSNLTTAPFFANFAPVSVNGVVTSSTATAAVPAPTARALKVARLSSVPRVNTAF